MDELERAQQCGERMRENDAVSAAFGIEIDIPAAGQATATMRVRPDMVNGFNVCHGGLIFMLADTAFAFACNAYDRLSVAASANIDFVRPGQLGDTLTASAREAHAGTGGGVYNVEVYNQHDKIVASFRGRSASRNERLLDR